MKLYSPEWQLCLNLIWKKDSQVHKYLGSGTVFVILPLHHHNGFETRPSRCDWSADFQLKLKIKQDLPDKLMFDDNSAEPLVVQ